MPCTVRAIRPVEISCPATSRTSCLQALTAAVVTAAGGRLEDDATALVLDWYGGPDQTRDASSGATADRASS